MDRPVNFSCCTRGIVVMYMEKVPIESMWIVEAKGRRDEARNGSVQLISGEEALAQVRRL